MAKCKSICFAKEKCHSCPKVITDLCGHFVSNFPLAYHWIELKPFGHLPIEFLFFIKELAFVRGHIGIWAMASHMLIQL